MGGSVLYLIIWERRVQKENLILILIHNDKCLLIQNYSERISVKNALINEIEKSENNMDFTIFIKIQFLNNY